MDKFEGVQTALRLSVAEDWPVTHPTRRIGWIDQRGRVYAEIPGAGDRPADAASFTPLLIELDE